MPTIPQAQNVIIIVFDALSAAHLPIYGYPRNIAPNISRFAEHSTVYHNHFASGNFTSPGTASLLTGNYPFSHRAFNLNAKTIPIFESKNIFSVFDDHYRVTYSHNVFVNTLLSQFRDYINHYKPRHELFLNGNIFTNKIFPQDNDIAQLSWARIIKEDIDHFTNSLFLSKIQSILNDRFIDKYLNQFPRGLSEIEIRTDEFFLLEHAIDWINELIPKLNQPLMGYFHFMPPHDPYNTSREFVDVFFNRWL